MWSQGINKMRGVNNKKNSDGEGEQGEQGNQSDWLEEGGEIGEKEQGDGDRWQGKIIFINYNLLIYFFFKKKFDQSDRRIFHATPWSAEFLGRFLVLEILAFWLVNFEHMTHILLSDWLNLLLKCKQWKSSDCFLLAVYCRSLIIIAVTWAVSFNVIGWIYNHPCKQRKSWIIY